MKKTSRFMSRPLYTSALAAATALAIVAPGAVAADEHSVIRDGRIGYVITDMHWSVFQTADGKQECPNGLNSGIREEFKAMFPTDGKKRKLVDTQLKMEMAEFFPEKFVDPLPFYEAQGSTAPGMNLDGKIGPQDFTSPEGDKGVDNQMYRAIGCIPTYRGPDGTFYFFANKYVRDYPYNRMLLELTGVDSLTNDSQVDVTIYRGLERMRTDASGNNVMPGGSQVVDDKWSNQFKRVLKGRIVNGVLETEPQDATIPWWQHIGGPWEQDIRGMRLRLSVSPTGASGLMAGYNDVDNWYANLVRSYFTLIQSYGQLSAPSLYQALHRLADGYPDPKTGANTAISSALDVKFAQVYVIHKQAKVASVAPTNSQDNSTQRSAERH